MRRILFYASLFICTLSFSQAPQYLNYQAIARDAGGTIITSPIGIKFEILQGSAVGTTVYEETNNITPSSVGVFTAAIGNGSPVVGTFTAINWANSPYFIRVSIDPAGGTSYSTVGTSELLSVPYALYAEKAGNSQNLTAGSGIDITSGVISNTAQNQTVNISGSAVTGSYPNYTITSPGPLTASTGISISGGTITNTSLDQIVTISGAIGAYPNFTITPPPATTITAGNSNVTITGSEPNFTISSAPTLSLVGAVLSISDGNSVTLPTGTTYTNGAGIALTSGTIITNTAPDQTVTIGSGTNVNVTGTYPSFVVNSTPTLALNTNTLSISGGNSVVINMPNPPVAGPGISIVTGTISNTAMNQTVTVNNGTNVNVTGAYPNFTVNSTPTLSIASNTLSISGGNFVTLPSSPTYSAGAGISLASGSITNTAPNQTVNVSGSGVTGSYPNYTVTATPQTSVSSGSSNVIITGSVPSYSVIVLNPVISGAGTTTVTNAGNNYTVNSPPVNMSFLPATGILSYTPAATTNTINLNPSLTFTNSTLNVGTSTVLIPGTGLWSRPTATATFLSNNADFVGIGTNAPTSKLDIVSNSFNLLSLTTTGGNSNINVDAFPTGAGQLQFRTVTANGISFVTANLSRMVIDGVGNVGIGITAPSAKLDVSGGLTYFRPNSTDINKILVQDYIGSAMRIYTDAFIGNPYDLILGTFPNGHLNQLFLKQSNGFVGVGTTSPATRLHVAGAVTITDGTEGDGRVLVSNAAGNASWRKGSSYAYFYPTATSLANVGTTAVMVPGMSYTYTKLEAGTTLEIDFIGHLSCNGVPAGAGVVFEIRVDGNPCTSFSGRSVYWWTDMPNYTNIVTKGIAENITAGAHLVQIWVYTSSGITSTVFVNPGNWTDQIIVKETH